MAPTEVTLVEESEPDEEDLLVKKVGRTKKAVRVITMDYVCFRLSFFYIFFRQLQRRRLDVPLILFVAFPFYLLNVLK